MVAIGNEMIPALYSSKLIFSLYRHSKFLYPLPHQEGQLLEGSSSYSKRNANMYPHFQLVTDQIVEGLQDLLSDTDILKKENCKSYVCNVVIMLTILCLSYFIDDHGCLLHGSLL